MAKYQINSKTYAIIPSNNKTKIIEADTNIYLNIKPNYLVDINCKLNGSSLEGRQKGSTYMIGCLYKPPILLNEKNEIILIPTHSVRNQKCSWIILSSILNYEPTSNNQVLIEFRNHKKICLDLSYTKFDNQVLRATRLESTIRGRNKQKYL